MEIRMRKKLRYVFALVVVSRNNGMTL